MNPIKITGFILAVFTGWVAKAQCDVQMTVNANGTLSKTTSTELIYSNETYSMYSQMRYDGIDHYFIWVVKPMEKKKVESKSMEIRLDNDSIVMLEFYDSYKTIKDTSVSFLYRVSEPNMKLLSNNNINQININTNMGLKQFILKLHKDQIREQLKCLAEYKGKE
jgi:hypothetical protein